MKNLIYTFLTFTLISCGSNKPSFDQETSNVINTFYSDALELRESYELLRVLSKDIGPRPSGSEGAKKAGGFTHVWANDLHPDTCKTFKNRHPDCEVIRGDVYKEFIDRQMI